jgi:nucleoside-diphosphate-sugar epimerase
LITGAAGFIGSHLAERCLDRGWHVTAVDSFTPYYADRLKRRNIERIAAHPSCTVVESDLLDCDLDLSRLLADVGTVFHLAAQPGVRASWDEFATYTALNLNATQRLLHAARGMALQRFVIASSSSIYGNAEELPVTEDAQPTPVSPYGVTKVATEQLAQTYWRTFGVPTVCLRYFTVFGPRQRPDMAFHRLIATALNDATFYIFGDGRQTRDFTYVDDAVRGTLAAAEDGLPGTAYNIGGGSRRSLNSVIAILETLLGRPVRRTYHERQAGDARDTSADTKRAREELGFRAEVDFAVGLKAQLDWQRAEADVLAPQLAL